MESNALVLAALETYGMAGAEARFIRHNENMTYCVNEAYLLRIHRPRPGFTMDFFHNGVDLTVLHEAELHFLDHLRTFGLQVQEPFRSHAGTYVAVLPDGTPATMLTWLPGRVLKQADLTPETGVALGEMLGNLHMASARVRAEHKGSFGRYDHALCERLDALLAGYHARGKLETPFFAQMSAALRVIGEALRESAASHMLVHSDLSLSNILLTEKGPVPIDFSLLGYSTPMLDFGSLFCYIGDEACQEQVIRGYEAVTGNCVDRRLIDCCLALQILLGVALHFAVWAEEPWFAERLPQWCDEVFVPLVKG